MDNSLSSFVKDNITKQNTSTLETGTEIEVHNFVSDAIGNDDMLNEIDANSKPIVVVLIGFPSYGKTSFVSTCYQLLLEKGGINEYIFYDSDTFIGFERRIATRRLSEKNNVSQTKRTLLGESHLLTIRINHPQKGNKVIVFSDRSGEHYEEYINKTEAMASDKLLKNADRLLFFINCEDLVGHSFISLKDKYSILLHNLKSNNIPFENITIDLLYNKSDIVTPDNISRFNRNKTDLVRLFDSFFKALSYKEHNIISNNIDNADGLKSLLVDIIDNSYENLKSNSDISKFDWVKNLILKQQNYE